MTLISLAARLRTFNWCVTSRHQLRSTRRCDHPIANREFEASRSFRLRSSYLAVHFGLNSVTQISVHQRILSYLVKNRISNPIFVYRSNGAVDNRSVIYSFHEKEKFAKRETRRERVFVTGARPVLFVFRGRLRRKIRFALSPLSRQGGEEWGGSGEQRSDVIPGHARRRCCGAAEQRAAKKRETRSSHRGPRVNEMPRCETRRPTFAAAFEEVNRGPRSD